MLYRALLEGDGPVGVPGGLALVAVLGVVGFDKFFQMVAAEGFLFEGVVDVSPVIVIPSLFRSGLFGGLAVVGEEDVRREGIPIEDAGG